MLVYRMTRRKQAKPRSLKNDEVEASSVAAASPLPAPAPTTDEALLTLSGDVNSVEGLKRALLQRCGYQQLAGFAEALFGNRSGEVDMVIATDPPPPTVSPTPPLSDLMPLSNHRTTPTPTTNTPEAAAVAVVAADDDSLESDALGTGGAGSSWRSDTPPEDAAVSPAPSSCATPNSASDVLDADLAYTVGVTEGTPYACSFCDKAFPRLSYLKKHEQTHSDQMPFRCDFCSRLFKHKRSRDRHIKLHTGDKKYRCTQCEAAFSRSDHLKIHMKTHDNQKPFQCTVCNRGYNTAAALTSHMQNHKKAAAEGGAAGTISGRSSADGTPSPGTLRCLQCGDVFRKPEDLQKHMSYQHQVDMSPPSRAASRAGMALSVHSPFGLSCMYCTKDGFNGVEALQLHVQAMHGSLLNGNLVGLAGMAGLSGLATGRPASPGHTNTIVQLSCELCTMRFNSVSGLHRHQRSVHGLGLGARRDDASALICARCSIPFPTPATYTEHMMLVHSESSQEVPVQLKPTDLSVSGRRSNLSEEGPPSKRGRANHDSKPLPPPPPPPPLSSNGDIPPHQTGRPYEVGTLLCNQCGAALPNFDAFRVHLKMHLAESGALRSLLDTDLLGLLPPPPSITIGRGSRASSPASGCSGSSSGAPAQGAVPGTAMSLSPCSHCGTTLSGDREANERHLLEHFLATDTEFGCPACGKVFPQPDELQRHLMDLHSHHLYRCALCRELFDSKVAIQVHFAVQHSSACPVYRCTACLPVASGAPGYIFRSEREFAAHVKNTHSSQRQLSEKQEQEFLRCRFCRVVFQSDLELQLHLPVHTKQLQCPFCSEAFQVEFLLDKHIQSRHSAQVLNGRESLSDEAGQAEEDIVKSNGRTTPKANGDIVSPDPILNNNQVGAGCDICDRGDFASEAELAAHRKLAHQSSASSTATSNKNASGALSLHCAYCAENCKSRTELENHMKTHSQGSTGVGKHKCNICDEVCPTAGILAEHKLTHCRVLAGSQCCLCRAPLPSEQVFLTHLRQHAAPPGAPIQQQTPLPAACVVCRQTLVSDVEVRLHARFHLQASTPTQTSTPNDTTQCVFCLQNSQTLLPLPSLLGQVPTFVCKDCYRRHTKSPSPPQHETSTHRCSDCKTESPDAYQCIKCQASFDCEHAVRNHVASHLASEGASPHECRLCKRPLASPLQLQLHLIEHTFAGCSSFTCYICSAVFTAARGLQGHMLEHGLSARPYDCTRCSQRFFFRAELDNHSISHHSDEDSSSPGSRLDAHYHTVPVAVTRKALALAATKLEDKEITTAVKQEQAEAEDVDVEASVIPLKRIKSRSPSPGADPGSVLEH